MSAELEEQFGLDEEDELEEVVKEFITVRFRDAWFGSRIRAIRKRTVALIPAELETTLPPSAEILDNSYDPREHPSYRFIDLRDVDLSEKPENPYSKALAQVNERDTRTSLKEFDTARDGLA